MELLTVFYEIITLALIALFVWNLLTVKDKSKQMSSVICLIPLVLRALFIH